MEILMVILASILGIIGSYIFVRLITKAIFKSFYEEKFEMMVRCNSCFKKLEGSEENKKEKS